MPEFLFVFGYESPEEGKTNSTEGTDFESSNAVWITASDEHTALVAGRMYADQWISDLFQNKGIDLHPSWAASGFAHWIEHQPLQRCSGVALDTLDHINA
jgi:hypothetical protein